MYCEAEPVGDVLVHRPALQPVEVLVQPLVAVGDEHPAAARAAVDEVRQSITRRLIPAGVNTRSKPVLPAVGHDRRLPSRVGNRDLFRPTVGARPGLDD